MNKQEAKDNLIYRVLELELYQIFDGFFTGTVSEDLKSCVELMFVGKKANVVFLKEAISGLKPVYDKMDEESKEWFDELLERVRPWGIE